MHNALCTMFFLIISMLSISAAAIVLALVACHTPVYTEVNSEIGVVLTYLLKSN